MFDSRTDPEHKAARETRKAIEKEHGYDNLKSMGLKAGVLAMMAGLALYPKISAEADVIEREMKMKADKKVAFRKRERARERDRQDHRRRSYGGERPRSRDGKRQRESSLMRVDELEMRRGEGHVYEKSRRRSMEDLRRANQRWENSSNRSRGSDRTGDWVSGGYEYLNGNDYRERDRRRW
jgi:hypothetical protein